MVMREGEIGIEQQIADAEGRLFRNGGKFRFASVTEANVGQVDAAMAGFNGTKRGLEGVVTTVLFADVAAFTGTAIGGLIGGAPEDTPGANPMLDGLGALREMIDSNTGIIMENFQTIVPKLLAAEGGAAVAALTLLLAGGAINRMVRDSRLGKALGR